MKSDRRRARSVVIVREYSDATGATAGSIIAVIIAAHMARTSGADRPIVPGPLPMSRAYAMTPAHASAAPTSSKTVSGVRRYVRRSTGVTDAVTSRGPCVGRVEAAGARAVERDAERVHLRLGRRGHRQGGVRGMKDVCELHRARRIRDLQCLHLDVDEVAELHRER